MKISIALITQNEEANLPGTLDSLMGLVGNDQGEILVVDSGSTDRTLEIARSYGAQVFCEAWKGFAAQKNSVMEKASGDWVLQLDADERLEPELAAEIRAVVDGGRPDHQPLPAIDQTRAASASTEAATGRKCIGYWIPRKNFFLGRWIKHGGFYPDPKLRLVRRGAGKFKEYGAHPTLKVDGPTGRLKHALLHQAYPTLSGYIDHMNSYSSSGAGLALAKGKGGFSLLDIFVRPALTFFYNYVLRLGFLDGREGFLLHLYHSVYVSWKYAKAWELSARRGF